MLAEEECTRRGEGANINDTEDNFQEHKINFMQNYNYGVMLMTTTYILMFYGRLLALLLSLFLCLLFAKNTLCSFMCIVVILSVE